MTAQLSPDLHPRPAETEACDDFHAHPEKVSRLRHALLGGEQVAALAETFKLLGDATRVRILDALSKEELCVCDLATLIGMSESAVSHQLRLLRGLRLVRPRRAGRMVFYALDDQHIVSLFQQGLRHVQEQAPRASAASGADR
jgi:ArsR family transcriptional regulator